MLCWAHDSKSILAIEASPVNYEYLVKNVVSLGVEPINAAVYNGMSKFVSVMENGTQSCVTTSDSGVRALSLDDVVDLVPSGDDMVLKVDTEGAEYEIMFSASAKTIRRFKTIFIECHPCENPEGWHHMNFIKEYMAFHGFEPVKERFMFWNMYNAGTLMSSTRIDNWVDFKFVRKE